MGDSGNGGRKEGRKEGRRQREQVLKQTFKEALRPGSIRIETRNLHTPGRKDHFQNTEKTELLILSHQKVKRTGSS